MKIFNSLNFLKRLLFSNYNFFQISLTSPQQPFIITNFDYCESNGVILVGDVVIYDNPSGTTINDFIDYSPSNSCMTLNTGPLITFTVKNDQSPPVNLLKLNSISSSSIGGHDAFIEVQNLTKDPVVIAITYSTPGFLDGIVYYCFPTADFTKFTFKDTRINGIWTYGLCQPVGDYATNIMSDSIILNNGESGKIWSDYVTITNIKDCSDTTSKTRAELEILDVPNPLTYLVIKADYIDKSDIHYLVRNVHVINRTDQNITLFQAISTDVGTVQEPKLLKPNTDITIEITSSA